MSIACKSEMYENYKTAKNNCIISVIMHISCIKGMNDATKKLHGHILLLSFRRLFSIAIPCTIIVTLMLSTLLGGLKTQHVTIELLIAADASTDSVLLRILPSITA